MHCELCKILFELKEYCLLQNNFLEARTNFLFRSGISAGVTKRG